MASSFKRRLLRLMLVTIVGLVVLLGFLPTIIGSKWIYQPLIDQFASDQFRLTIDSVRLRWFSPLQLDGIRLGEAEGPSLVTIRQVHTDRSLVGYMVGGRKLGRLEIEEPTVSVALLKDGSNLQRVIQALDNAAAKPKSNKSAPPPVDIEVLIHKMSVKVLHEGESDPLVVVPPFDIAANYQAASGESHLTIKPTRILDQVKLSKDLIDLGLGHAVPLLAKSAWFDGRVSLDVGHVDVPLQRPAQTQAKLQLTMHEVRSGPNDETILRVLDFIAKARGRESSHELVFVDGTVIDVTVANGRVHHEGLQFGLPKMDDRFQIGTSGTVGIEDRSLDLIIQVPVPIEHIAQRESVQQLGVPTLKLPITGTLDKPHLDWNALRGDAATLLGAIKETLSDDAPTTAKVVGALEGLANGKADETIAAAVDLIEDIRQRRQTRQQEKKQSEGGSAEEPPKRFRDAIIDRFKKRP